MAEYKRKDMPEDMIVRISPGRNMPPPCFVPFRTDR